MLRVATSQWFAENPGKARAERFFLLYSPVWMLMVASVQLSGLMLHFGDAAYLAIGFAVALPLFIPVFRPAELERHIPWHQRYAFKFLTWMWIFGWVGNYFFSEYFFDILGMHYHFNTTLDVDAALVGTGRGSVPFLMYLLTLAYFSTYHTVMSVLLRRIRNWLKPGPLLLAAIILVLSYAVAFAETFAMANPLLEDYFFYEDHNRMLSIGSLFYACYFIVSLPLVYRLDEHLDDHWTLGRAALEACAAGMIVFILLDFWALVFGKI